ncbi:MAG: Rho GTPase-activating protein [Sporothrix epigloea]
MADDRRDSRQFGLNSPTSPTPPPNALGELDGTSAADAPGTKADPTAMTGVTVNSAPVDASTAKAQPNSREAPKEVQEVLQSEIGIVTMLNRLKQSVGVAKEFAQFFKKRAQLEEEYSTGMRKLARATQDGMARVDPTIVGQSGSTFSASFGEMMDIHSRMADNGYKFSMSLHQMYEDLLELAGIAEKNRKGWKQTGLAAEQRVADLETAMRKSKAKYDTLAEEYDRVRTGDLASRRGGFGFKGHKSAAQLEEDLLRKVQGADEDYHTRVDTLARERAELLATGRPEIIRALQDLLRECDGGAILQVQKYASFCEKLVLSNGLTITPIKTAQRPNVRGIRDAIASIDSERDLNSYVASNYPKVPPKTGEPKYERHAVLGGSTAAFQPPAVGTSRSHALSQSVSHPPASSAGAPQPTFSPPPANTNGQMYGSVGQSGFRASGGPSGAAGHERSFSYSSSYGPNSVTPPAGGQPGLETPRQPSQVRNSVNIPGGVPSGPGSESAVPYSPNSIGPTGIQPARFYPPPAGFKPAYGGGGIQGAPQLGALPFQTGPSMPADATGGLTPQQPPHQHHQQPMPQGMNGPPNQLMQHPRATGGGGVPGKFMAGSGGSYQAAPPSRPMFGVSLNTLYERDSMAVPMVVYQCIQAVDLFGLAVEGIYRLSGSLPHVNKLKSMFDTDSASPQLDFRNPENFFHDVNSVAGLLKQFFRDLPDPLLTRQQYDRLIEAAQHDDDIVRRDSLHAVINDLPDPNYATLRALILHLNRVVENAPVTRMTAQNLAIVFGPTLMGAGTGDPEKARWHVRVIDTIIQNTYQIFDED